MDINSLARKNVLKLKPYSSARDEFSGTASVFLDANENPYPSAYNRYPDPHQVKLKQVIATIKGVDRDQVFLGNGSDEPIDLLIRAFCEPGVDNVLIPQPTYGMYVVSAEVNAIEIKTVTLTPNFDLDTDQIEKTWDKNTKLLFLCSPNNPTGNLLSLEKIKMILSRFAGLVIVDEAYIDFTQSKGLVPFLREYPNLVVLQTLSKAWGLAGIRLGVCLADPFLISVLNRIKPPYNISSLTQSVAEEVLSKNTDLKNKVVADIIEQRDVLKQALEKVPLVRMVYPSDANFLLVKVENAKEVYAALVAKGIIVRDRSRVILCDQCLRITVGTPAENKSLISELNSL